MNKVRITECILIIIALVLLGLIVVCSAFMHSTPITAAVQYNTTVYSQSVSTNADNTVKSEITSIVLQTESKIRVEKASENDLININTATSEELQSLNGIGPALALRIIDYRTQNGNFSTIDEIKSVKGIGDKKFDAMKDFICVE